MKVTNFHAFKLILLVNKFAHLTVPLPPSQVAFPVTRSDWINVVWNAPSPPHGIIISYEIRYWKTWSGNQTSTVKITKQLGSQGQTKKISNLEGSHKYSVQVVTFTSAVSPLYTIFPGWFSWIHFNSCIFLFHLFLSIFPIVRRSFSELQ